MMPAIRDLHDQHPAMSNLLLASMVTIISISITGFDFPFYNNQYHVPILLNYAELEQFKNDTFIQSLTNYVSGFWWLLKPFTEPDNITSIIGFCHYLSRLLAFLGLSILLDSFNLRSLKTKLLTMVIIAISPIVSSATPTHSYVGVGGMFLNYFTHSELVWGLLFLSFAAMLKNKIILVATFNGLIIVINLFVGLWMLYAQLITVILLKRRISLAKFMVGLIIFSCITLPIIIFTLSAISSDSAHADFSYIEYIRAYFSSHFLIEAASYRQIHSFICITLAGFIALSYLDNRKYWLITLASILSIFVIGSFLPYVFDHRFIFNLHLLRVDCLIQMLATIFAAFAGARLLFHGQSSYENIIGSAIILTLIQSDDWSLNLLCITLLAGHPSLQQRVQQYWSFTQLQLSSNLLHGLHLALLLAAAVVQLIAMREDFSCYHLLSLLVVLFLAAHFYLAGVALLRPSLLAVALIYALNFNSQLITDKFHLNFYQNRVLQGADGWNELLSWVRDSDLMGPFFIPYNNHFYFKMMTKKTVWYDSREGAAVMWYPAFYHTWIERKIALAEMKKAVGKINKTRAYIVYAQNNNIPHIILKQKHCPEETIHRVNIKKYSVCSITPRLN